MHDQSSAYNGSSASQKIITPVTNTAVAVPRCPLLLVNETTWIFSLTILKQNTCNGSSFTNVRIPFNYFKLFLGLIKIIVNRGPMQTKLHLDSSKILLLL